MTFKEKKLAEFDEKWRALDNRKELRGGKIEQVEKWEISDEEMQSIFKSFLSESIEEAYQEGMVDEAYGCKEHVEKEIKEATRIEGEKWKEDIRKIESKAQEKGMFFCWGCEVWDKYRHTEH